MARGKFAGTTGERFRRSIVPIEWWFLALPKPAAMMLNLCVEGAGRVDVDQLRAAVDRAAEACPGSRLARRGRTWVDSGISPEVRVIGNGRSGAVMPELTRSLPGAHRTYCEVLLLDTGPPTVVFRASMP